MAAMKLRTYAAISLFLSTVIIANAANQHHQFYPTVVNLVTSKVSRIILINDAILLVILFGMALKNLFFGSLRTYEEEVPFSLSLYIHIAINCSLNN